MGLILPHSRQIMLSSGNLPATPSVTVEGTSVAASGSIHTKGSYVQLIAATTYDSYGFFLYISNTLSAGADTSQLLDVAIGAAASEVVILPNFLCGCRNGGAAARMNGFFIPIFIPRGARIAARIQALISADTLHIVVQPNYGRSGPYRNIYTGCDAYGVDTADSGGTAHTPGNSGAESTDANVGTTLSRNYKAVMMGLSFPGTNAGNDAFHWELTNGTDTFAEWMSADGSSEEITGPFPNYPLEIPLPSGMQLMVQAESSTTGTLHDVAFYCFY